MCCLHSESSLLQLDELEEKIRAIPEKRCMLILREIPQNTPQKVGHYGDIFLCIVACCTGCNGFVFWRQMP